MMEFIQTWWPVVPSVVASASVIAKITPNKTDDIILYWVLKIVDSLALTTGKTEKSK